MSNNLSKFFGGGVKIGQFVPTVAAFSDASYLLADGRQVATSSISAGAASVLPFAFTPTLQTTATVTDRFYIVKGGSTYVAINSASGTTSYSSTDGINWTSRTIVSGGKTGLMWDNTHSVFIVTTDDATGVFPVASSPDGITWTAKAGLSLTSAADGYVAACSDGGTSVRIPTSGTSLNISTAGSVWTATATTPFTLSANSNVVYHSVSNLFVMYDLSVSTASYYTSATATTSSWTTRTFPFIPKNKMVRAGGKLWIIEQVSTSTLNSLNRVAYTTDGISWTILSSFTGSSLIGSGLLTISSGAAGNVRPIGNDVAEPYLFASLDKTVDTNYYNITGYYTQQYYTANGTTWFDIPNYYPEAAVGASYKFISATEGYLAYGTSGYATHLTIDSTKRTIPRKEGYSIRVI